MSDTVPVPLIDPAAAPAAAPAPLASAVVIDVTGADAATFLQGQFCNDVAALEPGSAQLTGYCTPKGRLIAAPVLMRTGTGFRMVLPDAVVAAPFLKRLSMFVLRADVRLALRDDVSVLALTGEAASIDGVPALPAAPLTLAEDGDISMLRWHDDPVYGPRWLVVAPRQRAEELAGDTASAEAAWRLADVRAGLPSVRAGTVDAFVPQMMNFREVGALSFTKGCYPGQEIVARSQYLGKQKRHMRRLLAIGDDAMRVATPIPGDALGDAGTAVVVDAVATPDGVELLAVVRIGTCDAGVPLGEAIALPVDLPYVLESDVAAGTTREQA